VQRPLEEKAKSAASARVPLLVGRAVRQSLVRELPRVLVLHLKRFDYGLHKLHTMLHYPHALALDHYMASVASELPHVAEYTLYGVSCHDGELGGGHYTCQVQAQSSGEGVKISDRHVQRSDVNQAVNMLRSAYLLFYCKTDALASTTAGTETKDEEEEEEEGTEEREEEESV